MVTRRARTPRTEPLRAAPPPAPRPRPTGTRPRPATPRPPPTPTRTRMAMRTRMVPTTRTEPRDSSNPTSPGTESRDGNPASHCQRGSAGSFLRLGRRGAGGGAGPSRPATGGPLDRGDRLLRFRKIHPKLLRFRICHGAPRGAICKRAGELLAARFRGASIP